MSIRTILCLSSYEKGFDFLREAKAQGWRVMLLTGESLRHGNWPWECLDEFFCLPDPDKDWDLGNMLKSVAYVARSTKIDRVVALDDFDVEKAALIREHLRIPGMGDTTARNFRDKLAMRGRAKDAGIPIPAFTGVFNNQEVGEFMRDNPGPWVLKPRLQANAIGIVKCTTDQQVWDELEKLGDERSAFLLECFIEGDICHVDSAVIDKKVVFACASRYGTPPMEVFHGGRVFTTRTLDPKSADAKALGAVNQKLLESLGLLYGVSHSEFIYGKDGVVYFLETSARVGGAHIAELVEFTTGINLWRAWAQLECAEDYSKVKLAKPKAQYGALMATLAQQEYPDMSAYNDPEVVWKLNKKQHAGLIMVSPKQERVSELLESYTKRFYQDFFASLPAAAKASQMN